MERRRASHPQPVSDVGLFDRVASAADLDAVFELEGWTNDRISGELGLLHASADEWVIGQPMASVIMAAYCHPPLGGRRFSGEDRGAWYAARTVDTALAESIFRRARAGGVGGYETRMQMRVYLADFSARFHDIRDAQARGRSTIPTTTARRSAGARCCTTGRTASSIAACASRTASASPASVRGS